MTPYDIKIQYVKGEDNITADTLSRLNEVFERVPGTGTVMAVTRSIQANRTSDEDKDIDLVALNNTLVHISGAKLKSLSYTLDPCNKISFITLVFLLINYDSKQLSYTSVSHTCRILQKGP